MSYQSQAQLQQDPAFAGRVDAANTQQAAVYRNDARPAFVALADAIMRGDTPPAAAMRRLDAAGPGIAEKVETGDGTIDQSLVTDADLLSLTQANWPTVAELYFEPDGSPARR
jgi:hypothetical protein